MLQNFEYLATHISYLVFRTSYFVLLYSYLNASIGSSFEAFIAGYEPETTATKNVVIKAAIIAPKGITKENSNATAIP